MNRLKRIIKILQNDLSVLGNKGNANLHVIKAYHDAILDVRKIIANSKK